MNTTLNPQLLAAIAAEAISSVYCAGKFEKRWINAIAKAVVEIETNPFWTWQSDKQHLVIWSQSSNETYTANGTCQCKAYLEGYPCYHRAAARLIQRYYERSTIIH